MEASLREWIRLLPNITETRGPTDEQMQRLKGLGYVR
jgi:hypothetical protein